MTAVDKMMNETILYGGLPLRRCDVYRIAREDMGTKAGLRFGADYAAFSPEAVDVEPLTIEEARRIFDGEP